METPLNKYLREHSSVPCSTLEWIEKQTNIRTNYPHMLSGSVQGEFLKMLVELTGSTTILEIGAFTGYSTCCLALGLPENGHIDTLEINDELEDLIREGWNRAGLEDRITLHIGDAADFMRNAAEGTYDFIYIDANKREYSLYYELSLPLLRHGGLIVADDVCQGGKVYADPPATDAQTTGLKAFNDLVAEDPRVEQVYLPIRDGLAVIRKI